MAAKTKRSFDRSVDQDMDEDDKKLVKLARKRFTETMQNWGDIRRDAVMDQKYYANLQSDTEAARAQRSKGGSPQIEINMLPTFVQQVENSIRQQNIGLNVHPTDEDGSDETAKILQGIIRHIEHNSQAKTAYLWAAGSHGALVPGFGFMKLDCNYIATKKGRPSFDQEIFIRGIKDPMMILPDFFAQMPDFSDADFWFEFEEMGKDAFKEAYGHSKLGGVSDWASLTSHVGGGWVNGNGCKVAKYWYRTPTIRHWAMFEDGTEGYLDEYGVEINDKGEMEVTDSQKHPKVEMLEEEKLAIARAMDEKTDPGASPDLYPVTDSMAPAERLADVMRVRECVEYTVCWISTNGYEILDRGDWNDCEFPFVGVVGKDEVIDGKRDMHGIIRYAKDPQKMVNFFTSQAVRRVDAANKSAWIASAESIPEPQRKYWDNANRENRATLYYQAYDDQGRQLAPPTRGDAIEPAVQQLMAGAMSMAQNIKATVGIYEAGLGQAMGDRQSGSAIDTLAERGENANFHFSDNFVMSMKRLGCLILRLIPKIYDTARVVRMVGLDDAAQLAKINQMFTENGQQKMYDIKNAGSYDVIVDTGPTFASKKSQMVDSMLKFASIEPQMMPFLADLLAKNMDWDTTGAVSDRIQLVQSQQFPWLHPADGQAKMPPQAVAQITQLTAQVNALQQASQHVQGLYAQEKMKNDTNVISHQAKLQQISMKGMIDLQNKKMDLLAQMQESNDKITLERVKVELGHINDKIALHLKGMDLVNDAHQATAAAAVPGLTAATQPSPAAAAPGGSVAPAQFAPVPTAAPPMMPAPAMNALPPGLAGVGGPNIGAS